MTSDSDRSLTPGVTTEPVVVEPVVNEEKLRELLALGAEYQRLDYKAVNDPSEKRDQVELAKDIGAMSVLGGFLIIGADPNGKPSGRVQPQHIQGFDEARLRPRLLKWLPESLILHSQGHIVDGNHLALIYVAPNPTGCAFFRSDGQYELKGERRVVFREGDSFFRHGTSSVRIDQSGFEQVIAKRLIAERRRWEAAHAHDYKRLADELRAGFTGQHVASGPSAEIDFALEPDVLIEAAVELLRRKDYIPLKRLLKGATPELRRLYASSDGAGIDRALDQLASLAATFLDLEEQPWLERAVAQIWSIYGIGFEGATPQSDHPTPEAAKLWLATVEHAYALGALAVRQKAWTAVRNLTLHRDSRMDRHYTNWFRHALVMAARARLLDAQPGSPNSLVSLLTLTREIVRRVEHLRLDVAADDDSVLTSLAQFDFLACVVALGDAEDIGAKGSGIFYPNFARFNSARTQPIASQLINDPVLRETIYPKSDSQLSAVFVRISEAAHSEGIRFDGWWGYGADVEEFIRSNASSR